jgi:xanthine dehydrogenase accessory factor
LTGDLLRRAARMERERRPFALATVVRSERPTSGKPGNAALIDPDGTMHGWIGGSCTRSEVIRHALEALRLGEPRLLAFGADEGRPADLVKVSMSCASGGKVEVHINPVLPAPVLLVVGDSPVALALLGLGRAMGYRTVAAASSSEEMAGLADECAEDLAARAGLLASRPPGTRLFAVVATMGREDERTLALLAGAGTDYLGVVASPRRMRSVRAVLADLGLGDDAIGRIRGPAGLDLGAEQPEEIAVSILAEIVGEVRRVGAAGTAADDGARAVAGVRAVAGGANAVAAGGGAPADADATSAAAWATDPVCGMTVPVAGSATAVHNGRTLYFCCEGCRGLFESTPEVFASNPATGPA